MKLLFGLALPVVSTAATMSWSNSNVGATTTTNTAWSWSHPSTAAGSIQAPQTTGAAQVSTNPTTTTPCGQTANANVGTTTTSMASGWHLPSMFGGQSSPSAATQVMTSSGGCGQVSTQANTASTVVDSNGVSWYLHGGNMAGVGQANVATNTNQVGTTATTTSGFGLATSAAGQVNTNHVVAVPVPAAVGHVVSAPQVAATVSTVSGHNSFTAQNTGRGSIRTASVSGPGGTLNAVVSGASTLSVAQSNTNSVASSQISRTSSTRRSKGSSKGKGKGSRSRVQSYEALAGVPESGSVMQSIAMATTAGVFLLWNLL